MIPAADLPIWLLILTIYGLICGMIGGALGYAGTRGLYDHIVRRVEIDVAPTTGYIRAPVHVDLSVRVPELQTIQVPVEGVLVSPTPNAEIAARIVKNWPAIRGRGLATIFDVSSSTGQAYYNAALKLLAGEPASATMSDNGHDPATEGESP